MKDRIRKRGRPKLEVRPRLSCLRNTWDTGANGLETYWQKNEDGLRDVTLTTTSPNRPQLVRRVRPMSDFQNWKTYNGIYLTNGSKRMIIEDQTIDDSVINAAQVLLQKRYPSIEGLQNVLLCYIDLNLKMDWNKIFRDQKEMERLEKLRKKSKYAIESLNIKQMNVSSEDEEQRNEDSLATNHRTLKECEKMLIKLKKNEIKVEGLKPLEKGSKFVQILLDDRKHWICVSNVKTNHLNTVRIYDSDLKRVGHSVKNYSLSIRAALKRMYCDCEDIKIELPLVSQSTDQCSGGVYSIAFAQALCAGQDPSQILFSNSAKIMRAHLLMGLETGTIDAFPTGRDTKLFHFYIQRPKDSHKRKTNK